MYNNNNNNNVYIYKCIDRQMFIHTIYTYIYNIYV